jgi:hypothetical protein
LHVSRLATTSEFNESTRDRLELSNSLVLQPPPHRCQSPPGRVQLVAAGRHGLSPRPPSMLDRFPRTSLACASSGLSMNDSTVNMWFALGFSPWSVERLRQGRCTERECRSSEPPTPLSDPSHAADTPYTRYWLGLYGLLSPACGTAFAYRASFESVAEQTSSFHGSELTGLLTATSDLDPAAAQFNVQHGRRNPICNYET